MISGKAVQRAVTAFRQFNDTIAEGHLSIGGGLCKKILRIVRAKK